jgi:hypothetical protein
MDVNIYLYRCMERHRSSRSRRSVERQSVRREGGSRTERLAGLVAAPSGVGSFDFAERASLTPLRSG